MQATTSRWPQLVTMLVLVHQLTAAGMTQGRVTSVGIGAFVDESGAQVPSETLRAIGGRVQQVLNETYKDNVLARALSAEADRPVDQLGTRGAPAGVRFVVRGGVLSLKPESVQLYADVIAVDSRAVTTVRAEGAAGDVDAALASAISNLSSSIHEVITRAGQVATSPGVDPGGSAPSTITIFTEDQTAETEEELWQLMAQADTLLASPSAISSATLDAVSLALESLKGALEAKAATVADGRDASDADRVIATGRRELQSAVSAAAEQSAMIVDTPASFQETGPRKNLLSSLAESLAGATQVLQQIQDLRAAWHGVRDDQSAESGAATEGQQLVEEAFEEVDGAVTEDGEPVEGVTVTDPESGATATTDADGAYVLRVVAGKPSRLVLTRKDKEVAATQLVVQRGRPGIADFELRPRISSAPPRALKVMPSTVLIKPDARRSDPTGTLSGVIRDARGRPQPRALVSLRGVAVARTDSQGRYAFIGVPAGTHQMTVYRPGLKAQSRQVQIIAQLTSQSNINLAANDSPVMQQRGQAIRSSGTGTLLKGLVVSNGRQPLTGAKVTLLRRMAAVSVLTSATGSYAFRDIEPGEYRAVVTKFGYETESDSLELRSGRTETRSFTLKKSTSPVTGRSFPTRPTAPPATRTVPRGAPEKPRAGIREPTAAEVTRRSAPGGVRGQVVDARTGKPVMGAAVSISGARNVETDRAGGFVVGNVPPGLHLIVVKRNGYADGRANITIRAGETATVNVRLTPRAAMRRR